MADTYEMVEAEMNDLRRILREVEDKLASIDTNPPLMQEDFLKLEATVQLLTDAVRHQLEVNEYIIGAIQKLDARKS